MNRKLTTMDTKQSLYTKLADLAKPLAQEQADVHLTNLKDRLRVLIATVKTMALEETVPKQDDSNYVQFCKLLAITVPGFNYAVQAQAKMLRAIEDCARYQAPDSEPQKAVEHQRKQLKSLQEVADIFPTTRNLLERASGDRGYGPLYGHKLSDVQNFLESTEEFLHAL